MRTLCLTALVSLGVLTLSATSDIPRLSFVVAQNPTVGLEPYSSDIGDFNRDGIIDVAVANYADNSVSVLFGVGDGTFQPAVTMDAGTSPTGIVAGDLNGDQILDLIVGHRGGKTVLVFLGNADGTFQPPVAYLSGNSPRIPVIADFNNDGIPDFATPNVVSNDVSIFLGIGDGTFQTAMNFPVLGTNPKAVVAADFNLDGNIDLATGNEVTGDISVMMGNGDGTLQTAVTYPSGNGVRNLAGDDLNGDGIVDLVVVNGDADTGTTRTSSISVFLGNADGTFQSAVHYQVGSAPRSVAITDLDGDGYLDLAVVSYSQSQLNILMGNGDGTFIAGPTLPTGPQPTSVRAGDFNQDGKPDLVVTIGGYFTTQNYVTIFLNTPLIVSKTLMSFRFQSVGSTSSFQAVSLRNIGLVPLSISGVSISGANPEDFAAVTSCPLLLAPGTACGVHVTFTPTATGVRTANLSLIDGAALSPQIVLLQGKAK